MDMILKGIQDCPHNHVNHFTIIATAKENHQILEEVSGGFIGRNVKLRTLNAHLYREKWTY